MDKQQFNWPLMQNNITREDLNALIAYLEQPEPRLTAGEQVTAFESEWSDWLGVKYSVFVNSGSSANLLSLTALKVMHGDGEIIVPTLTWVSDIASVIQCGFTPVFVDIDLNTLGMDSAEILARITPRTRAVFLTHILGYNALDERLLGGLATAGVPLIEDVCESHGATFQGRKLGTYGLMSNFSFYYAHHMSTIEGGMVCTNDEEFYETVRMLRAHGMVRELASQSRKERFWQQYPDLNPDFVFMYPAYNFRSTELNAVLGRSQLKHLDENNAKRRANLDVFLDNLDPEKYFTDFRREGSSNYALTLVIRHPDPVLYENVVSALHDHGIEFRRGTSGGGNQLRQPYLRRLMGDDFHQGFPRVDHVHFFGFYIGNYPELDPDMVRQLCSLLNGLEGGIRKTQ